MIQLPDIPASRQAEITSTDRECEPNVPTIFAIAGKNSAAKSFMQTSKSCIWRSMQNLNSLHKHTRKHTLTALDGSRMEAIRIGSSSSRWFECILFPIMNFAASDWRELKTKKETEWWFWPLRGEKELWNHYWFQRVYYSSNFIFFSFFLLN